MRNHKKRQRETNVLNKCDATIALGEYSELWNIYKLTSYKQSDSEYTDALTLGDYVSKIFSNLGTGTNIVNNYLVPANEFVDPVTGSAGKLRLKNNGINNIADPDVDTFFSKWLWKGFLHFQSPQALENERTVYYMTKGEPITNDLGLITNTDVYCLYAGQNRKLNGTFKYLDGTSSFMDSNVAKNDEGEWLQMNFLLKPSQPQNAKYIKFIPKSKVIFSPRTFKVMHNINVLENCYIDDSINQNENILNYGLDAFSWKVINDSSFQIASIMWPEVLYQKALWDNFRNNPATSGGNWFTTFSGTRGWMKSDNYIGGKSAIDTNYSSLEVKELIFVGSGVFDDDFIDFAKGWRINKGTNASQIPLNTAFTYDISNSAPHDRNIANWKGNNSYILGDMYQFRWKGYGKLDNGEALAVYNASIAYNEDKKIDAFKKFVKGDLSINSYPMNIEMEKLLIDNFPSGGNIELVAEPTYFFTNAINNGDFEPFNWYIDNIQVSGANLKDPARMNIPNPWITFANGLLYDRPLFSNSNYSDDKFIKDNLIFEIGINNGYRIDNIDMHLISGDFELEFLDKNHNPAIAIDSDGNELVLGVVKLPSPQRIAPINTQLKITYI